jgi:hypothetical protein
MAADAIRSSPLAYLRGLIQRAHGDQFTPEAGLQVAARRNRRREIEAARQRIEAAGCRPPPSDVDTDNSLVQHLVAIRDLARRRARSEE